MVQVPQRWFSIDVMRSLAIIFMIQNHFLYFLSPWNTFQPIFFWEHFWYYWMMLYVIAAQVFLFLSGFSLYLWIKKNSDLKRKTTYLAKRSVMLMVLGVYMSFLVEYLVLNDVLLVIGLGTLLLSFFFSLSRLWIVLLLVLIVIFAPLLQNWAQFYMEPFDSVEWATRHDVFYGFELIREHLINYFVRGYQPVIPWLVFPLGGYLWASCIAYQPLKILLGRSFIATLMFAVLAAAFSFVANPYLSAFSLYPMTSMMVFLSFSFIIAILGVLYAILDVYRFSIPDKFRVIGELFSQFSLTIYVFHLTFLVLLLHSLSWFNDLPLWTFYGSLLTVHQAILTIALFIFLLFFVLLVWKTRFNGRFSLEWWLRR